LSERTPDPDGVDNEDLGSLTVEDDPQGTVDPADLAGTANESDAEVTYQPEYSEEDTED
jgi:hypothetical protein